ncbi:MAG: carbonic anhydrase [Ignavibacteriaceae bacterium]|nr:carbonic anhydrase [Ignavibacteriaceae bacterium]
MKSTINILILIVLLSLTYLQPSFAGDDKKEKPSLDQIIQMLKEGNERFSSGKSTFPNSDAVRLQLAGKEDQGNYAYATILSCSDSRVPVEIIFDAGVMDLFVVRVAGNVADTDEIGTIEYGLAHVNTPVLVVLGHTKCGAVTAVTQVVNGEHHKLEYNIPPLVDNIIPAVKKTMEKHKDIHGYDIVPFAIEENVWQSIEDLFMHSASTRRLVASGKVMVVGAIYDISTGKINWLPIEKTNEILEMVEASPNKITQEFAE